ncbi:MAG: ATP-binding cassette domain-containing protein [Actinobacteria bacterium]|nr:ATP-binding cassette domain-containing protein [Actinomycetota bacterium]
MKSSELRLLLSLSGGRRLFVASIVAACIWSLVVVVNGLLIAEVVARITGRTSGVPTYLAYLAALWILRALFQPGFEKWCMVKALEMKRELRSQVTVRVATYSEVSSAQLSTILTKGLNSLDVYLGRFIPQVISASIVPLVVIGFIFFKDALSGVIALVTLPLIPLFGALIGRYSADSVARKWQSLGTLSRYFEDSLRGFATLKIFGRNATQSVRIAEMGEKYTVETMQVLRISFLSAFALELIATLSVAVIAVSVGLRLVGASIDFKSALVILILAPDVYSPVRNAASLFHASQDGTQALNEISQFAVAPSAAGNSAMRFERKETSGVSWQDWIFEREGGQKVFFAAGSISRGGMLFISGESGIGKTTFSQHLLGTRFGANVMIKSADGDQLLQAEVAREWQKDVGWIPQNPQLAYGTVRDQFQLLVADISDFEIETSLLQAGLRIDELPQGLDTAIGRGGEQGHSASGGQIRRIAVARALLRKPALIIADEPTADLDSESARKIMEALRVAQAQGAMVICITHDAGVALAQDQVLCVERARQ